MAGLRGVRPDDSITVLNVRLQTVDEDVPDIAGLVDGGIEGDFRDRLFAPLEEQHQMHGLGMSGKDGEVNAIRATRRAKGPAGTAARLVRFQRRDPQCRQILNPIVFR